MTGPPTDHRHLRRALEFAVMISREGMKRRPPLPIPESMKRFTKSERLPSASLGPVRRAVEAEDEFRRLLGIAATPDLVDEVGLLWLQRPDGWEDTIEQVLQAAAEAEADAEQVAELRRERRRREAAEAAAARSRTEVVAATARAEQGQSALSEALARVEELDAEIDGLRTALSEARIRARHARDRERAAIARAEHAERVAEELAGSEPDAPDPEPVTSPVDRAELEAVQAELVTVGALADSLVAQMRGATARLERSIADTDPGRDRVGGDEQTPAAPADEVASERDARSAAIPGRVRRRPVPMLAGVAGDDERAVDHLVRSGALVLVDGYNVSMTGWPGLELASQRHALLDHLEALASRVGAEIVVVFDGADVTGASAERRRSIRVAFSPQGVTADDVVRDEVRRLPVSRQVVVVTSDAEIVHDVRAAGANTVPSDAFLAATRR